MMKRGVVEHIEREASLAVLHDLKSGKLQHRLCQHYGYGYQVGDVLVLMNDGGDDVRLEITYVTSKENQCALSPVGLNPDYCILSLKVLP